MIALVFASIVIPWLNPIAGGPSAVIEPWLVAAACTVLLWVVVRPETRRLSLGLVTLGALSLVAASHESAPVLLAVAGLIVIAISAAVAGSVSGKPWLASAIANAWLLAALASSLLALTQYFGLSTHLAPWLSQTVAGEAFANLRQRNQFASLTSIGLAALLWRVQLGARLSWALPAAILLAVANAASASRTGAFQIVLMVMITLWWLRTDPVRNVTRICIAAVLSYSAAAILLPSLLQHLAGVTVPNAFGRLAAADGCSSRMVLWDNVLHLIGQKPWGGWGWGELDYAHFATLYPGGRFCDILDNAHNLPLHLAVELGVPIALLACGGFVVWFIRQRPWREGDVDRRLAWLVLAVILLHSLLEYPLWYGPFQMAFGFSLGMLATRTMPKPPRSEVGRPEQAVVSGLLALALLYTAWDYHRISQLYLPPEERSSIYQHRSLPRIGDSWLFRDQVAFAALSVTPLNRDNAQRINALALEQLHYSPEPKVIETAIDSAMLLGREDQALWLLARYRAAFPQEAARAVPAVAKPELQIRN